MNNNKYNLITPGATLRDKRELKLYFSKYEPVITEFCISLPTYQHGTPQSRTIYVPCSSDAHWAIIGEYF